MGSGAEVAVLLILFATIMSVGVGIYFMIKANTSDKEAKKTTTTTKAPASGGTGNGAGSGTGSDGEEDTDSDVGGGTESGGGATTPATQNRPVVQDPETCVRTTDESKNPLGAHQCSNFCDCKVGRYCTAGKWCHDNPVGTTKPPTVFACAPGMVSIGRGMCALAPKTTPATYPWSGCRAGAGRGSMICYP